MRKPVIIIMAALFICLSYGITWAKKPDVKGSKDHSLVSRIPNFYISSYKDIEFDQYEFQLKKGKKIVGGRTYQITYKQQKGATPMSSIQKVQNYTNAMKKIGGEVLYESKSSATMKVNVDKSEIWLRISNPFGARAYALTIVEKGPMRQDVVAKVLTKMTPEKKVVLKNIKKDKPGSRDHPLVTRIPNFYISSYKDIEFGSYDFQLKKGKKKMEGRKYEITYRQQKGATLMSNIQKVRNYTNAIKKIGGEVIVETKGRAVMKVIADNREVWLQVSNPFGQRAYALTIVEKQSMKQEVTADAEAMLKDINQTGHVAVYGIHFDTGKSTIKPSSAPAFKEIKRLLKLDPKLNIYVIGHTDMVGTLSSNMRLAESRASAVVKELVTKYKINKNRLTPKGTGPLCPVASNKSKEGKAKNRRVELVEKI
ncbi:MAG: OmpA family protein [Deltaproteobacteria bacterium]|nr:OmpA family protein [Deltaproteobacteria bacterium]